MTVYELYEELDEYIKMGMGDEEVWVSVEGKYAKPNRTEPGDGMEDIYILDEKTV